LSAAASHAPRGRQLSKAYARNGREAAHRDRSETFGRAAIFAKRSIRA